MRLPAVRISETGIQISSQSAPGLSSKLSFPLQAIHESMWFAREAAWSAGSARPNEEIQIPG